MKTNGFTLVEMLIAIGLAALFLPALVYVFSFSLGSANQGENYTQAYALAQEQMEVIYYLKENDLNWNWSSEPENTAVNEYYQPTKNGSGIWSLGSKTSSPLETNGHTITVQILPVKRTATGDITEDEGGIPDDTSRKIIVNVTWMEKSVPTQIDLVAYVSQH